MVNIYPLWWDQTVTIYNKYEDPQTNLVTWYRTVVDGCFWKNNIQKMTLGQETIETNSIICRIRKSDKFLEKYDWKQLPNDQMSEYFTLGKGDIIIRGAVEDSVDEYTKGQRSSDLKIKYVDLGCMEINNIGINTGDHVGMEHYVARGM